MQHQPHLDRDDTIGDFSALLRQLDQPTDVVVVDGGYANFMARIGSAEFRRHCGAERR